MKRVPPFAPRKNSFLRTERRQRSPRRSQAEYPRVPSAGASSRSHPCSGPQSIPRQCLALRQSLPEFLRAGIRNLVFPQDECSKLRQCLEMFQTSICNARPAEVPTPPFYRASAVDSTLG